MNRQKKINNVSLSFKMLNYLFSFKTSVAFVLISLHQHFFFSSNVKLQQTHDTSRARPIWDF